MCAGVNLSYHREWDYNNASFHLFLILFVFSSCYYVYHLFTQQHIYLEDTSPNSIGT